MGDDHRAPNFGLPGAMRASIPLPAARRIVGLPLAIVVVDRETQPPGLPRPKMPFYTGTRERD